MAMLGAEGGAIGSKAEDVADSSKEDSPQPVDFLRAAALAGNVDAQVSD
jgi:hypothetical protein